MDKHVWRKSRAHRSMKHPSMRGCTPREWNREMCTVTFVKIKLKAKGGGK